MNPNYNSTSGFSNRSPLDLEQNTHVLKIRKNNPFTKRTQLYGTK